MACRGFLECILKLLNFLMTLAGLAMVGYEIYLFIKYKQSSSLNSVSMTPPISKEDLIQLGRPFLALFTMSSSMWDDISSACPHYMVTCAEEDFYMARNTELLP